MLCVYCSFAVCRAIIVTIFSSKNVRKNPIRTEKTTINGSVLAIVACEKKEDTEKTKRMTNQNVDGMQRVNSIEFR